MKCRICGSEKDVVNNSLNWTPMCLKCLNSSDDETEQVVGETAQNLRNLFRIKAQNRFMKSLFEENIE